MSPMLARWQKLCRRRRSGVSLRVTYVEAAVVADNDRNPLLSRRFDSLVRGAQMRIEPVSPGQAEIARQSYRDFGKGRHKAGFNLGDCFAYALAKEMDEPLLFKGDDFRHTDIEPAEGASS